MPGKRFNIFAKGGGNVSPPLYGTRLQSAPWPVRTYNNFLRIFLSHPSHRRGGGGGLCTFILILTRAVDPDPGEKIFQIKTEKRQGNC